MPVNVSLPRTSQPPEREGTLNQNNKGPCAESWVVINSPGLTEASGTPAMADSMSAPLQAMLLGHTPNAGGISAKKGDFFRKFPGNANLRVFK